MKTARIVLSVAALVVVSGEVKADTQMEVYQETNSIVFVIDGQPAMILDKEGLHVREGVSVGGSLQDNGREDFDAHLARVGEAQNRAGGEKEKRDAE